MISLKGKWALVTGATRGIGKLASSKLASEGVNIIVHSRTIEGSIKRAEELKLMGVETFAVAAKLDDLAEVEAMLKKIDEAGMKVEVILNNAGLQIAYRTDYLSTPDSDYTVSFLVNTIAPMRICYHFLPAMIEGGFGRIVNTTSGIDLEAEQAGYSAAKAALSKVTRDLGYKLNGSDVIISLTDPGWCRTDLGGPNAPNDPASAVPGVIVGAFINDGVSGRLFPAQDFAGMSLEEAVKKAETVPGTY